MDYSSRPALHERDLLPGSPEQLKPPLDPLKRLLNKLQQADETNQSLRAAVQEAHAKILAYERLEPVLPAGLSQAVRVVMEVLGISEQVVAALIDASRAELNQLTDEVGGLREKRNALQEDLANQLMAGAQAVEELKQRKAMLETELAHLQTAFDQEQANVEATRQEAAQIRQQAASIAAKTQEQVQSTQLTQKRLLEWLATLERRLTQAAEKIAQAGERAAQLTDRCESLESRLSLLASHTRTPSQVSESRQDFVEEDIPAEAEEIKGEPEQSVVGPPWARVSSLREGEQGASKPVRPKLEVVPEVDSVELEITGLLSLPVMAALEKALAELDGVEEVQVAGGSEDKLVLTVGIKKGTSFVDELERLPGFDFESIQVGPDKVVATLKS